MTDLKVHADIYDASGNKLGAGPIDSIVSVSLKRRLDGGGSFEMALPLTDKRAVDLIQNERRVRLYFYDGTAERELGRGVIRKKEVDVAESELSLFVSGPDDMVELTFPSCGRGLTYDNLSISTVVSGLVGLASGWTASVDGGLGNHSTRIDGGNPLNALIRMAQQLGLHIRPALTTKTLEFGEFGTALGLRADGPVSNAQAVETNDELLLVDRLTVVSDSNDIVNYIVPLGGGEGDAAITLEHSTRTTPYTIQSTTKNGATIHYISDSTSITAYGQIEINPLVYKNIVPISNSATGLERAANALYDAAVADLERLKDPLHTYRITVKKPRQTIRPGDKLPVRYKGVVERENSEQLTYVDIDDTFWIMTVDERISGDGVTLMLDVASVDRHQKDSIDTIVGALEEQQVRSVAIQPFFNKDSYVFKREISSDGSGYDAEVPIYTTDSILTMQRCLLRIKTRPFRATATGAASDGGSTETSTADGHTHTLFRLDSSPPGGTPTTRKFTIYDGASTYFFEADTTASAPATFEPTTAGSHDHDVTIPTHTHNLDYGITDDTTYPEDVRIKVNGVDRTTALGGPWGTTSTEVDEELDITTYINAAATLQQEHTVLLSCDVGQGEIEVVVELIETIQSLGVT